MSLSRVFYWLFSGSLLILFLLLGYGWYAMYLGEQKRLQEDIDKAVQHTADILQDKNLSKYDVLQVYTDKDYNEKIAFSAGLTQNRKRISIDFDSSNKPKPATAHKEQQVITVYPNGKMTDKPVKALAGKNAPKHFIVNYSQNKPNTAYKKDTGKDEPFSITIPAKDIQKPTARYVPEGLKTIASFDSALTIQLKKDGLMVPYTTEKVTRPFRVLPFSSGSFIINFYDPVIYRVVYKLPIMLLVKRLLPYTGLSIFLLLLVAAAFVLYHKSYRLQLQTAQFRESLLSNVTHELKTPVASLQLIMSALRDDGGKEPKQQEYIAFADKELGRMKLLIEKILSFSKLSEKQFALNKEIIDIGRLVEEAIAISMPAVANAGGRITFDNNNTAEVMGDRILLLNMIINLIDNATKYSAASPVINIAVTPGNGTVQIAVADNGIGIAQQYYKRIFEPFFRIPDGDKYTAAGHGIGLSFVQQTVRLHKGQVSVQSAKGQGSTFTISLPLL